MAKGKEKGFMVKGVSSEMKEGKKAKSGKKSEGKKGSKK